LIGPELLVAAAAGVGTQRGQAQDAGWGASVPACWGACWQTVETKTADVGGSVSGGTAGALVDGGPGFHSTPPIRNAIDSSFRERMRLTCTVVQYFLMARSRSPR